MEKIRPFTNKPKPDMSIWHTVLGKPTRKGEGIDYRG